MQTFNMAINKQINSLSDMTFNVDPNQTEMDIIKNIRNTGSLRVKTMKMCHLLIRKAQAVNGEM